jgi:hypothetical protein
MKELRAALKPDRIDEQGEKYRLNSTIDIDAELANDDADQQRSRDAAEDKVTSLQFSNEVAERDGDEEREQRLCREQAVQQVHVSVSLDADRAGRGRGVGRSPNPRRKISQIIASRRDAARLPFSVFGNRSEQRAVVDGPAIADQDVRQYAGD